MKPLETLRALGTGGEAPAEAKQRVYGALMASLGAAASAAAVAKSAAELAGPKPLIAGVSGAKLLLIAGGIWLIGGATGAAVYGLFHQPEVRVVYVDRPVLASAAAASPPSPTVTASNAAPEPASAHSAKRAPSSPVGPSSELARERGLLDLARAAAARGEPAVALEQTQRHRAQFPHGKLAEEREAMAIRALLSLGRAPEAAARARAFRLAYPNSFLTPAIDSALSAP